MTRVVKLGGRAQSAAELPLLLAEAWTSAPGSLCVVHGGGDEISALQRTLGGQPAFAGGRRVTTAEDLRIIRMALSGLVNKRLVSSFVAAGAPAVGISGEDAALIAAQPLGVTEFGHVGMPSRINVSLIQTLWGGGFLPVISPLGTDATDSTGAPLNINGDDAAAAIAVALHADELLLLADVSGVLDDTSTRIPHLSIEESRALVKSGVAVGGMTAKLEAAHAALAGGVTSVRIGDLTMLNDDDAGTGITIQRVSHLTHK